MRMTGLIVAASVALFASGAQAMPVAPLTGGDAAARVLARAVARGVFSATSLPGHAPSSPLAGTGLPPAWRDVFGA